MFKPTKKPISTDTPTQEHENDDQTLLTLLKDINVLCRDNGTCFDKNNSQRVDVIKAVLSPTDYSVIHEKLYLLCHKKELSKYGDDTILISTHIDCKQPDAYNTGITRCFSTLVSDDLLLGTYDNSITNTSVLYLMLQNMLPDNVMIAFTGDEEKDSEGAIQVTGFLKKQGIGFKCIVLDVTAAGWNDKKDFTVENNFWGKKMGGKVISEVEHFSSNCFVFQR